MRLPLTAAPMSPIGSPAPIAPAASARHLPGARPEVQGLPPATHVGCARARRARHGAGQRGVTLIECCAVIAVLAVLAGAAAPAFVDHLDQRRLEGRASELGADLQHLRSLAVSMNEGMRISFGADAHGSCYVIHRDTDGPCPCTSVGAVACDTAQGDVLKTVVLPATSGLQVSANVASIRIDPKMGTSTPGGTVRLRSASGRELRHVVNIMGRVRTCSPAPGVPGHRRC